jgi:hypothetical protein
LWLSAWLLEMYAFLALGSMIWAENYLAHPTTLIWKGSGNMHCKGAESPALIHRRIMNAGCRASTYVYLLTQLYNYVSWIDVLEVRKVERSPNTGNELDTSAQWMTLVSSENYSCHSCRNAHKVEKETNAGSMQRL